MCNYGNHLHSTMDIIFLCVVICLFMTTYKYCKGIYWIKLFDINNVSDKYLHKLNHVIVMAIKIDNTNYLFISFSLYILICSINIYWNITNLCYYHRGCTGMHAWMNAHACITCFIIVHCYVHCIDWSDPSQTLPTSQAASQHWAVVPWVKCTPTA